MGNNYAISLFNKNLLQVILFSRPHAISFLSIISINGELRQVNMLENLIIFYVKLL